MSTRRRPLFLLALLMIASRSASAQGLLALLNPGGDRQLGVATPQTGNLHPIGTPVGGEPVSTTGNSEAIDRAGNRFFFVGTPNGDPTRLFLLSTVTGAVLSSPNVSNAQNGIMMQEYHAAESKLVCLVSVGAGGRQLCTVNLATGAVSLLGGPLGGGGAISTSGFHAIDAANDRFFFLGTLTGESGDSLYSVSTTTGNELASPLLSGPVLGVRHIAWDAAESVLYGIFTLGNLDAQLGTINTATGVVTLRGNPLTGGSFQSSGAALDEAADRYYLIGVPNGGVRTLYTLDTVNGLEIDSHEMHGSVNDILALLLDPGPLFADGFNAGNFNLWSSHQP